jgi:hypothetical protein
MDDELRKLERLYQADPSLGIAEKIVQCRMRAGAIDTLLEVNEAAFGPSNWFRLNENPDTTYSTGHFSLVGLQLPHGFLLNDLSPNGGGLAFIPGIKVARKPYKPPPPIDPWQNEYPGA